MDGVSAASGVAGLLTLALQVGGALASYVMAIKERSRDIKELQDELLLLGEVLSSLRDFLHSEATRGRVFDERSVLRQAILDCRARIERIGDRLRPVDHGKVGRVIERLKWPFEQKEVLQMIENLRRFSHVFQFALSLEGCTLLSQTSQDVSKGLEHMLEISNKITEMSKQMGFSAEESSKRTVQIEQILSVIPLMGQTAEEVREVSHAVRLAELREQERQKRDVLDWLVPLTALHAHQNTQTKRAEGTGKWFLESTFFQEWLGETAAQRDFLCIGGPGVGKSVLCSSVIDFLRGENESEGVSVVFYYCDYAEQQLQTGVHFARCILRQLCTYCKILPVIVSEFYQKTRNHIKDQLWFQELKVVLQRVLATIDKCFLVIDAFDETEPKVQRTGLLEVLNLVKKSACITKIFATTRPHVPDIENKFQQPIRFDVTADEQDMRYSLTKIIESHPDSEYVMDEVLKNEILDKLCANAHGMFLLPALQIQHILDQITKADVKRALNDLSSDLRSVFASTIDRIRAMPDSRRSLALTTLMWLSHVQRPLKMDELQHALAVRSNETDLNRDNFIPNRTILDSCCGLVEYDHQASTVRLVHFSLEEYLQTQDHNLFEAGHVAIARTCLHYIAMDSLQLLPFKNRADFGSAVVEFAFLEYASTYWGNHATKVLMGDIQDLAVPILTKSSTLMLFARVRDHQSPDHRKWKEQILSWAMSEGAGVSVAASFGLTDLVRSLISQSKKPVRAMRSMYGSTPLHEAAYNGHENTAELLIAHDADLLDTGSVNATPFFLAVSFGRLNMAANLLKFDGRQLNITSRDNLTALHKAVDIGSEPMVNFLLSAGADVGAIDSRGHTPLHHAAQRSHFEIARILVACKNPVQALANDGTSALDLAAATGHEEMVKFLLDNGADPTYANKRGWTALQHAARNGHGGVVRQLIKRGSNVFLSDWRGSIVMHQAARSGDMDTVLALLDCDDDRKWRQLCHADRDGSTPRVVAFYTAHYSLHRYLRSEERRLSGTPSLGTGNKLMTAIEAGDLARVQELVESQHEIVDLEAPDEDGQRPLHIAVQERKHAIAEYLLGSGRCSIHAIGYHNWQPLDIAASLADEQMVDLCLSYGANVHASSTSGQTALHKAASAANSVAVMERLLSHGANPEARNHKGLTPLHVAANHSNMAGIKLLLRKYNANILARDIAGKTPSQWAERGAYLEVLVFLKAEETKARAKTSTKRKSLRRASTSMSNMSLDSLSLSRTGSRQEMYGEREQEEPDLLLE